MSVHVAFKHPTSDVKRTQAEQGNLVKDRRRHKEDEAYRKLRLVSCFYNTYDFVNASDEFLITHVILIMRLMSFLITHVILIMKLMSFCNAYDFGNEVGEFFIRVIMYVMRLMSVFLLIMANVFFFVI